MTRAEEAKEMIMGVAELLGEVQVRAGIVVVNLPDGSRIDFTEPHAYAADEPVPKVCEKHGG